jgi:hypothetical protein
VTGLSPLSEASLPPRRTCAGWCHHRLHRALSPYLSGRTALLFAVFFSLVYAWHAEAQEQPCGIDNLEDCVSPEVMDSLLEFLTTARVAAEEGRWEEALINLRQANDIAPLGLTRLAIARALVELGRAKEARTLCVQLQDDPDAEAREGALELLRLMTRDAAELPADEPASAPGGELTQPDDGSEYVSDGDLANGTNADIGDPAPVNTDVSSTDPVTLAARESARRGRTRLRIAVATLGATSLSLLTAGVWAGLRAGRLEQSAVNYDFSRVGASRDGQDAISLQAAQSAQLANVLFISGGTLAGVGTGLLLGRASRAPRAALSFGRHEALLTLSWVNH